jgi:hypothetical protein
MVSSGRSAIQLPTDNLYVKLLMYRAKGSRGSATSLVVERMFAWRETRWRLIVEQKVWY